MAPRVGGVIADLGVRLFGGSGSKIDAAGLVDQRADPAGVRIELDTQMLILDEGLGDGE